jgi:hypothetical protein
MMQGGRGIKGPGTVPSGEPVEVEVDVPEADSILVHDGQPGSKPTSVPIPPGGKVVIPARPEWVPGTILYVYTNSVPVRGVLVEIGPAHE